MFNQLQCSVCEKWGGSSCPSCPASNSPETYICTASKKFITQPYSSTCSKNYITVHVQLYVCCHYFSTNKDVLKQSMHICILPCINKLKGGVKVFLLIYQFKSFRPYCNLQHHLSVYVIFHYPRYQLSNNVVVYTDHPLTRTNKSRPTKTMAQCHTANLDFHSVHCNRHQQTSNFKLR